MIEVAINELRVGFGFPEPSIVSATVLKALLQALR